VRNVGREYTQNTQNTRTTRFYLTKLANNVTCINKNPDINAEVFLAYLVKINTIYIKSLTGVSDNCIANLIKLTVSIDAVKAAKLSHSHHIL